jgi:hypothetical protein
MMLPGPSSALAGAAANEVAATASAIREVRVFFMIRSFHCETALSAVQEERLSRRLIPG